MIMSYLLQDGFRAVVGRASHLPSPPNVHLARAVWSLFDVICGILIVSWGCW